MDAQIRGVLKDLCSQEVAFAIVTIINTKGSTPRKPGTKMLVTQDGQVFGTIGGGCGEAEVRREALNALSVLKPSRYMVNMTQENAAEEGMVCGGLMEVFIDILPAHSDKDKQFLLEYIDSLTKKEEPVLVTLIEQSLFSKPGFVPKAFTSSARGLVSNVSYEEFVKPLGQVLQEEAHEKLAKVVRFKEREYFIEHQAKSTELIILGGGHIALPLAKVARLLGYYITVIDDRPSFANTSRFDQADRVICNDFKKATHELKISTNTYIVIVTRGHQHDKACLEAVINSPAAYIGMIGSRRRVKALKSELLNEGVSSEVISRVFTPIGLEIGAETPEEIAISILAQIISVHRGGKMVKSCEES